MAWFELHQELVRHRKTKKLARILKVPRVQAIGHLVCLWSWALDHAGDGDLSAFDTDEIAEESGFEGDPDVFFRALVSAGWVDSEEPHNTSTLHDWDQYTGRLIAMRAANRDRARDARVRAASAQRARAVSITSAQRADTTDHSGQTPTRHARTVRAASAQRAGLQNRTEQNQRTRAATPRKRNILVDTLAEIEGSDANELTRPQARALGVAVAQIREATPDVSPDDIRHRAAVYASKHPTWELTGPALAKHWAGCSSNGKPEGVWGRAATE